MLQANASVPPTEVTFPPLPHVPEPAIFDPSYAALLDSVLSGAAFPPNTPPQKIYGTRLKVIEGILASRKESAHSVSINLMVAFVSMALLCVFLLVRIRRNRQRALLGDTVAAQKIVLPAFEPLLWLLGGLNLTLIVSFGTLLLTGDVGDYYFRVTIELAVGIKLINGLLVVTYMQQPSLSVRALWVAVGKAFVFSMYTVPVVIVLNAIATQDNQAMCYWTLLGARALIGIYLCCLVLYPPARASVLSFRLICLYGVIMVILLGAMSLAYHSGKVEVARILGWVIAVYSALLPLSVWHVLRADTEHWRGIGKRAVELQDTFRRKSGKIEERVSSQGLHVLIEMHRKYIIDFARLEIYEPIKIVGSDDRNKSVVYRGFLHTKKTPVAIKVYMPTAFTEEVVAAFSHEAALCGALVHPNIVKFHGLCVCPPNICLVTELCQGSLQEVKESQVSRRRQGRSMPLRRQQILIDIGYMIDAARAIAYVHSFSPPFVHRDIKPSSFLVDDDGTVKLTDFGASRTLSVRPSNGATTGLHQQSAGASQTVLAISSNLPKHAAQFMAPEVIRAQHAGNSYYGEAADMFSLAMTMWDILHPDQIKYPASSSGNSTARTRSHGVPSDAEILERVFAGERPSIDPDLNAALRGLIEAAWHADPRVRPTAMALVASLEAIQEELCASFALELMDGIHGPVRVGRNASASIGEVKSFAGTQVVEQLRIWDAVGSQSEAIRLGNMLMDCGFVHHTNHTRCFEYTSSQYMFDAAQVMACQPLALLESDPDETTQAGGGSTHASHVATKSHPHPRRSVGSSMDEYTGVRPRTASNLSSRAVMGTRCACRKLGQRIETERSRQNRFRFKFKVFSEESQLTASLLADDQSNVVGMGVGHFEALHEPSGQHKGRKGAVVGSELA